MQDKNSKDYQAKLYLRAKHIAVKRKHLFIIDSWNSKKKKLIFNTFVLCQVLI